MHREIRAQKIGVDIHARAIDQHDGVLKKDGRAQSRNHGRKPARVAQGPVGRALQQKADQGRQQGHHDKDGQHGHGQGQHAGEVAARQQGQPQIGADGEQVAVGKVDELEHAIHHGVAQSHQRIDAAHGKAVQKLLKKLFHAIQYSLKSRPAVVQDSKSQKTAVARPRDKQTARNESRLRRPGRAACRHERAKTVLRAIWVEERKRPYHLPHMCGKTRPRGRPWRQSPKRRTSRAEP